MKRQDLDEEKILYKCYKPSSSTLHLVEEKLNVSLRKRFGRIRGKDKEDIR